MEIEEKSEALGIETSRSLNLPSLLVSLPPPSPGFESQPMAYDQVSHEPREFITSQWVDYPAGLLTSLNMHTRETGDAGGSVAQLPTVIRGDYHLDLSQVALVQEFI